MSSREYAHTVAEMLQVVAFVRRSRNADVCAKARNNCSTLYSAVAVQIGVSQRKRGLAIISRF